MLQLDYMQDVIPNALAFIDTAVVRLQCFGLPSYMIATIAVSGDSDGLLQTSTV